MMKEIDFTPPFRVGRKQKRAVLDAQGREVVIFPFGLEEYAKEYAEFLNTKKELIKSNKGCACYGSNSIHKCNCK